MASILELVFDGKVTIENVSAWLDKKRSCQALDETPLAQAEFIQYFLNFLRDQSAPILQGCRSANATPSKTPTVLKSQRSITFSENNVKTSTPRNSSETTKRVQLFAASPLEGDSLTCPSDNTKRPYSKNNESSLNCPSFSSSKNVSGHGGSPGYASWSHNSSLNTTASPSGSCFQQSPLADGRNSHPGSAGRRQNRSTPGSESFSKRNRNNSIGSYTPDAHRSQHKHNLGEFLVISNTRKKKSPKSVMREEISQQSQPGAWKMGGKGKGHQANDNKRSSAAESGSPFTLNDKDDFPKLGLSIPQTTTEEPSSTNESSDIACRMITPSRKLMSPKKNMKSPIRVRPVSAPRRITPTAIVPESSSKAAPPVFMSITTTINEEEKQPNAAFSVVHESRLTSLAEERKLLREARMNHVIPASIPLEETTPQKTSRLREMLTKQFTPTKLLMDKMSSVTDAVPEISQVTFREKLDVMADLYSVCLKEYMVPNVTVELYFVVQLLTTRGLDAELAISYLNQDDDDDEVCYLASIHNAVYFAVSVLQKQQRLLALLDKGTLRLFIDNQRIADFSRTLRADLLTIIEMSQLKVRALPPSSPVLGVSFQADTDNRKNFPHDRAFHTFKKQRDNFYELLREWQDCHMQPGWSMRDAMTQRIRDLVGSHIDLTNHVHFARLFQSQLLMMCKGDRSHKVEGDDANISLLSELKQTNPAKFKRLQERFISPQSVGSPCPQPSFPGCQEFFRDFVIIASSYMFNHHLTHTMVEKITDLNGTQFTMPESESDNDGQVDPEDLETLSMCLLTLRLLGKFLGFLTFLPYQSSEKLPDTMEGTIINMRNQVRLPVDTVTAVRQCMVRGRTVLTTPWVVEFLSMMDPVAPRLDQVKETLMLLVQLYRTVARDLCEGNRTLTLLLVVTSLGWLFELSIFPEGMFFKSFPYGLGETSLVLVPTNSVDKMDLVDHNLFFTCCPYVAEVKSLLMGFAVGSNNKGSSIRKITPMTTETESIGSVTEKQLQAHLEENFFHNHPASMKRTVEFVADRVSSNYIKKFRASHLPRIMQEGSAAMREVLTTLGGGFDTRAKRKARQQIEDLSLDLVTKAHGISSSEVSSYAQTKAGAILPLMLPEDTASEVIRVANAISARLAQDKVVAWMATHITKAMFMREYSPEFEKQLKALTVDSSTTETTTPGWETAMTPATPRTGAGAGAARTDIEPLKLAPVHDGDGPFPSEIMVGFKEVLRDLVMGDAETLTPEDVFYQIGRITWCLENRQDTIPGVFKSMSRMTVDMSYALVLRYPLLWTAPVEKGLIDVWVKHLHPYTDFSRAICLKHIHWISSVQDQVAWKNLSAFIIELLENCLTTSDKVEVAAASVLQTILPAWLSVAIETFLRDQVSQYPKTEPPDGPQPAIVESATKDNTVAVNKIRDQDKGAPHSQGSQQGETKETHQQGNMSDDWSSDTLAADTATAEEVRSTADVEIIPSDTTQTLPSIPRTASGNVTSVVSQASIVKKPGRRSLSKEWGSGFQDGDLKPLDSISTTNNNKTSCDNSQTSQGSEPGVDGSKGSLSDGKQNSFCDSDFERGSDSSRASEPETKLQISSEKPEDAVPISQSAN